MKNKILGIALVVMSLFMMSGVMAILSNCNTWTDTGIEVQTTCTEETFLCTYESPSMWSVVSGGVGGTASYASSTNLGTIFNGIEQNYCSVPALGATHTQIITYDQTYDEELGGPEFGSSCTEYKSGDLPYYAGGQLLFENAGNGIVYSDSSQVLTTIMDECFQNGLALVNTCLTDLIGNIHYVQTLEISPGLTCGFQ